MGNYKRVTPIGYNTGKLIIGCHYLPEPKPMTESEYFIQGLVRGRGLPPDRAARDVWLKVKSMFRRVEK